MIKNTSCEENNLAAKFPQLASEWIVKMNDGRNPEEFTCGSGEKVWWKCSVCGNEWKATINHRANGRGCPECAQKSRVEKLEKRNLVQGETDLATLFPEIAAQWCFEENGELLPTMVSPKSNKNVWWRCEKGHVYQMRLANRTAQGQGCPICAGKQILAGFNDLKSQFPEIAARWDFEKNEKKPEEVAAHSNEKAFWCCDRNHSYIARVAERTGKEGHQTGCPYCAGKKVWPGFNDLATVRPDLAAQWDEEENKNLTPADVTEFSMKKVHWVCDFGHKWIATVAGRSAGNGCPICANKQLLSGYNDIKTLFPKVAEEWDYETNKTRPEEHFAGTHKKVSWKCLECGNVWVASIKERTYGGNGCPRCSFYHKTSFPEQAILFYIKKCYPEAINSYKPDYLAPKEMDIYIPELNLAVEYDGKAWHTNSARDFEKSQILKEHGVSLIRLRERGLPPAPEQDISIEVATFSGEAAVLTGTISALFSEIKTRYSMEVSVDVDVERDFSEIKAVYEGTKRERSLLYANPEILKEWNYEKNGVFTPDKVTPHSQMLAWWTCSRCGKEWQQRIRTKMLGGLLCESCSKSDANMRRMEEAVKKGCAKAVADYSQLMKEWDHVENAALDPTCVSYGSERKVAWICASCENHFRMMVKNRTIQGQGCPLCGRKKSAQTRSKKK